MCQICIREQSPELCQGHTSILLPSTWSKVHICMHTRSTLLPCSHRQVLYPTHITLAPQHLTLHGHAGGTDAWKRLRLSSRHTGEACKPEQVSSGCTQLRLLSRLRQGAGRAGPTSSGSAWLRALCSALHGGGESGGICTEARCVLGVSNVTFWCTLNVISKELKSLHGFLPPAWRQLHVGSHALFALTVVKGVEPPHHPQLGCEDVDSKRHCAGAACCDPVT